MNSRNDKLKRALEEAFGADKVSVSDLSLGGTSIRIDYSPQSVATRHELEDACRALLRAARLDCGRICQIGFRSGSNRTFGTKRGGAEPTPEIDEKCKEMYLVAVAELDAERKLITEPIVKEPAVDPGTRKDAISALAHLGYRKAAAEETIDSAIARLGDVGLNELIRGALQRGLRLGVTQ